MGIVVALKKKSFLWKIKHKLFNCPTFWRLNPYYTCPRCGKGMRCYWDGNDVSGHGIDYCDKCADILENSSAIVVN